MNRQLTLMLVIGFFVTSLFGTEPRNIIRRLQSRAITGASVQDRRVLLTSLLKAAEAGEKPKDAIGKLACVVVRNFRLRIWESKSLVQFKICNELKVNIHLSQFTNNKDLAWSLVDLVCAYVDMKMKQLCLFDCSLSIYDLSFPISFTCNTITQLSFLTCASTGFPLKSLQGLQIPKVTCLTIADYDLSSFILDADQIPLLKALWIYRVNDIAGFSGKFEHLSKLYWDGEYTVLPACLQVIKARSDQFPVLDSINSGLFKSISLSDPS